MATRRLLGALTRCLRYQPITSLCPIKSHPLIAIPSVEHAKVPFRCYSSRGTCYSGSDEDDEDKNDSDDGELEDGSETGPKLVAQNGKSEAEKIKEAAAIGYTVIGPLTSSENPFKPYKPIFAVVQIGSHQFKVSNGDSIFVERLKYCDVNDKLVLSNVLMVGSRTETIIGRPVLPDAAVHAIVEEHALNAKVIIFKKKRRKNYRRTKGHRQELTKLRITDILGINESVASELASPVA